MPKIATPLTAAAVAKLKEPGRYAVGGADGLHLRITPAGTRLWVLRAMFEGKRIDFDMGRFEDVSLSQARDAANDKRREIRTGTLETHPPTKKSLKDNLFREIAEAFIAEKAAGWRNPKHQAQWSASLATYAYPVIGDKNVAKVDLQDILSILRPIWLEKTETASRVRGRVESVLDYATVQNLREGDNPARWKGALDKILPAPSSVAKARHMPAMPLKDMPDFYRFLIDLRTTPALALRFLILTAARPGEIRFAKWSEIDMGAKVWVIPWDRMKAGVEHRIPLSREALAVLAEIPRIGDYLFAGARVGRPVSDMAMTMIMRSKGIEYVPHGFRSTFRDWAGDHTNYPRDLIEMALAHTITNKAEAAYRRSDAIEKRRPLMQEWADLLTSAPLAT